MNDEIFESEVNASEDFGAGDSIEAPVEFSPISRDELLKRVEAVVFASPQPMKSSDISLLLHDQATEADVESALAELMTFYDSRSGGFRLEYISRMGYQFRTVQDVAPILQRQFAARPRPLSRSALETLAIVAYRQPCTRADIEFVRGVDAGSIIKGLMDRGLIACVGRKEEAGRPMLFGTTEEFLKIFRLGSLKDMPPLAAFQPPQEVVQNEALVDSAPLEAQEEVDVEPMVAGVEGVDELGPTEITESLGDLPSPDPAGEGHDSEAVRLTQLTLTRSESEEAELQSMSGAEATAEETHEGGDDSGTDQATKVAVPDGDSVEAGSGEVDH